MAESTEDAEILEPVLGDEELALRVIAASSLFGLGHADVFPILVEGMASDGTLPFSHPPQPVSFLAKDALEYYTGEAFDSASDWEDWWEQNGDALTWDGEMCVSS